MSDLILPFYLVCDEAKSSRAGIQALNEALDQMHAEIGANSSVVLRTRFCLIGFSGDARVVRPLSDMGSLAGMPRLNRPLTIGPSSCAAAFDLLYETITRGARGFAANNIQFPRPAVFFLAGTELGSNMGPVDQWMTAYQRLTDPSWPWHPNIVTFGDDADKLSLRRIATVRAFSLDGSLAPRQAAGEMVQALSRSIVDSSRAQTADGSVQFIAPERVTGFAALTPSTTGQSLRPRWNPHLRGFREKAPEAVAAFDQAPAPSALSASRPSPPTTAPKVSSPKGAPAATAANVPAAAARSTGIALAAGPAFPEARVLGRQAPAERSPLNGLPGDWHRVPDTVLDGADLKGLAVRGASLRGDAHRDKGETRQDAMGIYPVNATGIEAILGCVADGKDNEPLSHFGAEQACLLLRDEVMARLPFLFGADSGSDVPAVCKDIAESVAERLALRAGFVKAPPRALSTTLAVAVVEASGTARGRRCVVFAVGDCAGLLVDKGDLVPCFPSPSDGEPASLPTRVGQVAAQVRNLAKGDALILCTPGLAKPLRQPEVRDQFLDWWQADPVPSLPEFAWQLSFRARSCEEDRTAVCFLAR